MGTDGIAVIGRTVQNVVGTTIGVPARSWAVSIADFICFDNTISTDRSTVAVVIVIATSWTASVTVRATRDIGKNASDIASGGTSG